MTIIALGGGCGIVLDISVERETRLSKDVLRIWERRYGFPNPARDENGERQYAVAQVAKLRTIKRPMDVGMRPGRIVRCTQDELNSLAEQRIDQRAGAVAPPIEHDVVTLLRGHDATGLQNALARDLMRQGLRRFVLETMMPLNRAVGDAWMRGELQIFKGICIPSSCRSRCGRRSTRSRGRRARPACC